MTSITAGQTYRSHQAKGAASTPSRLRIGTHFWVVVALLATAIVLCAVPASNYATGPLVEAPYIGP